MKIELYRGCLNSQLTIDNKSIDELPRDYIVKTIDHVLASHKAEMGTNLIRFYSYLLHILSIHAFINNKLIDELVEFYVEAIREGLYVEENFDTEEYMEQKFATNYITSDRIYRSISNVIEANRDNVEGLEELLSYVVELFGEMKIGDRCEQCGDNDITYSLILNQWK